MDAESWRKSHPLPPRSYRPAVMYGGGRKKSFEAEDGQAILRSLSASRANYQRLSLRLHHQAPGMSGSASSGLQLVGGSLDNYSFASVDSLEPGECGAEFFDFRRSTTRSLPRCISDSSVGFQPGIARSSSEVKRNHSLKVGSC